MIIFKKKIEMLLNKFKIKDLLENAPMQSERNAAKENSLNKTLILIDFFYKKKD